MGFMNSSSELAVPPHGWGFVLRTAVAYLKRDWRAGELRVVALALVIAVSAVSSVSFFTKRVENALELQAAGLLGGDLLLRRSSPLPDELPNHARQSGLQTVDLVEFPSVVLNERDDVQLVAVKAVSSGYPLRGVLKVRDSLDGDIRNAGQIPLSGEVWLDKRLFLLLEIQPGDSIALGDRSFKASQMIESEPDRGGFLFQLAPRVLLNVTDLVSTGLIAPASRVRYSLQVAGGAKEIVAFGDFVVADAAGEFAEIRIEDVRNGRPGLRRALVRADQFLGLTAMVTVLLAGAAVAVATQGFAARQADASAVLRTFGATRRTVFRLMLVRLACIAAVASGVGVLLGYTAQWLLVTYFASEINLDLPGAGWYPFVLGGLIGFTCLIGFGLPAVLNLDRVPIMRVLRRELQPPSVSTLLTVLLAFSALSILMVWQANDLYLAASVIVGLIALLLIVAITARLLLWSLHYLRLGATPGWRFGVTSLLRRQNSVVLQLSAFCVGIMALLLIAIVGDDVLEAWRNEIPADAPNHFAFNIQPQEVKTARQLIADANVAAAEFYPMVRGRLIEINGVAIDIEAYPAESRARHLLHRDYNLSYAAEMRPDYTLEAGEWWGRADYDEALISVESSIAETFNLSVGDQLAFRVAGTRVAAKISNIRTVNWDSFKPNFFVISTPSLLSELPVSFITSFRLAENDTRLTSRLVRSIPGATVIDVNALIARIRGLIETVALAVEYVLGFTLLAGLVVLIATVQASRRDRMGESALLKVFGASYKTLFAGLLAEFVMLGAIAGLIAALIAGSLGWAVSSLVFDLSYQPTATLLLVGLAAGAVGIGLCGVLVTRQVLGRSPMGLLNDFR
jgi:putative ABC transport system permease protein